MRPGKNAVRPLLALFVLSALLTGLVAGCGGGDQSGQSGGGGERKQSGGEAAEQGGGASNAEEADKKIALGTIRAVKPDKGRISLKPTVEDQGDGSLAFRVAEDADITLDGRPAEVSDIKGGQQAQIEYVSGERSVGRVLSIQLFAIQRQQEDGQNN